MILFFIETVKLYLMDIIFSPGSPYARGSPYFAKATKGMKGMKGLRLFDLKDTSLLAELFEAT
jgi:hypothetical protein